MLYNSFAREKWRPNKYGTRLQPRKFRIFSATINTVFAPAHVGVHNSRGQLHSFGRHQRPQRTTASAFGLKWDMGWMNDTIRYYNEDPVFRRYKHYLMTEYLRLRVPRKLHPRASRTTRWCTARVPCSTRWRAAIRTSSARFKTAYTMMMGHPGKKLLFMGQDFGQEAEWDYKGELPVAPVRRYRSPRRHGPATAGCCTCMLRAGVLYNDAGRENTFEWINNADYMRDIFSFIRRAIPGTITTRWCSCATSRPSSARPMEIARARFGATISWYFPPMPTKRNIRSRQSKEECDGRPYRLVFTLRPYESLIFAVPYHESTEEEKEAEAQGDAAA